MCFSNTFTAPTPTPTPEVTEEATTTPEAEEEAAETPAAEEETTDGEMAGTQGQSLRLEAIQIKIVPKVKKSIITLQNLSDKQTFYNPSSINVIGWKMSNVSNTKIKAYVDNTQI